ncbi:MAG: FxsA family protein [Solirubrobacteraceae bacterium]|nr:FxsA family protein [Solirubrobacteraceae bacterium]
MVYLLVALFIVVPILELYVLIQVGQWIGVLPTIALLILDSILGSMLLRQQGRGAWRRVNVAVAEGRIPARETIDGALVIFGGALLLTPGFLSDILGLFLLLPPTRAVVRPVLVRWAGKRMTVAAVNVHGASAPRAGGYDVDGTATEVDRPTPGLQP